MNPTDIPAARLRLVDLLCLLWRDKGIMIVAVTTTSLLGVAYALLATPVYRAEVVMTQAGQRGQSGGLGQLSNLASLAGVNIGSTGSGASSLAVLKSREFAEDFIRELNLERILDSEFEDPSNRGDSRDALATFLSDVRVITEDKKAGTVTLSIFWKDPIVAANWANAYVERLNIRLRDRALVEAERNVRFLQQEMASTNVVSMQQSIGRIMETEMQKYMLAKGEVEYAYRIVDRAAPPKLRDSPRRTLIVVIAALLGGALGTLLVLLRSGVLRPKN